MKYGIYSDIHSNLEALEKVLESMETLGVERRICLGDAVGYGANPNECVNLIRNVSAVTLLGNHDSVALGRESSENFNFYARKAIEWTKENLDGPSVEFLDKLPYVVDEPPLTFVHASPRSPVDWYYITSFDDAIDAFSFFNEKICFVGHTHIPSIVVMENEQSFWVSETLSHKLLPNQRILVNVGSVGQPRDRIPSASWCLCDTNAMTVEIVRVNYDINKTQERMRRLGFAEFLINRLAEGR
jgi:predicted phosphodiesterase